MEYEHGAENQPMDGNPSMRGPSESATHIARADSPQLSDPEWEALQRLATVIRVGGTPKTGNSHWSGGRSDDATDIVTDRSTRCCSGLHSQGAARCCCRYGYDGAVRDDTARAVIETAREQLCGKRGGTSSPMACRSVNSSELPLGSSWPPAMRHQSRDASLEIEARPRACVQRTVSIRQWAERTPTMRC
ncbi:hypothetical protein PC116_g26591 [Phytophthora cactorum]|uniref:Uncharacterized protein n=1 Tax=Phytophthora cactorum TaxID=29920 RepID=A0A8T1AYN9_9STRA|nr:hypothetical protein PC114_g24876 [Phytophthora cactorum]KAG2889455.1 hypothetical protein PC117_g24686 [Phytophthora cactorum]KAG3126141.1 hypothetical protein C6341_g25498 [Phytophthora cactorum]KAG4224966.1 hypothetical protein PC116_g26591 [Phytophthora cactorum]